MAKPSVKILKFCAIVLLATMFIGVSSASAFFLNHSVKTMTRNLYLGADIFKVLEAAQNPDPDLKGLDVPVAVAELFQTVQYTNFPERAESLANEIWFHRPHLIGLQEVSLWYIQSPGDMAGGGITPADTVVYDFLQILMDALAARGLNYQVAVATTGNADIELPMLTGFTDQGVPTFDDLRLLDRDVILVRGDVDYWNTSTASYNTNIEETVGGIPLEFTRGWAAADVDVRGSVYRFVNTHLEVRSAPGSGFRAVQAAQMQELMMILSEETRPVILVGDFNSSPTDVPGVYEDPEYGDIPYVPPYQIASAYGYLDAWNLIFCSRDGYTSGFDEYVSDPTAELTSRIDLVFIKPQDRPIWWVTGTVTGDQWFNMTPGGLWPSDHGGVVINTVFGRRGR